LHRLEILVSLSVILYFVCLLLCLLLLLSISISYYRFSYYRERGEGVTQHRLEVPESTL
jgi:hypothetical protein